jgi:hypothetical protein
MRARVALLAAIPLLALDVLEGVFLGSPHCCTSVQLGADER